MPSAVRAAARSAVVQSTRSTIVPALTSRHLTTLSTHHNIPTWATLDPNELGTVSTHNVLNVVGGQWQKDGDIAKKLIIPNPLNKDGLPICTVPDTSIDELGPFIQSMEAVSKSGVHNPLKAVERYLMYGEISRKVKSCDWIGTYMISLYARACPYASIYPYSSIPLR